MTEQIPTCQPIQYYPAHDTSQVSDANENTTIPQSKKSDQNREMIQKNLNSFSNATARIGLVTLGVLALVLGLTTGLPLTIVGLILITKGKDKAQQARIQLDSPDQKDEKIQQKFIRQKKAGEKMQFIGQACAAPICLGFVCLYRAFTWEQ